MPRKKIKNISDSSPASTSENTSIVSKKSLELSSTTNNNTNNNINNKSESTDNQIASIEDDIIEISQLKGKEIWHYSMLEKFFSTCDSSQTQRMVDIINGNHLISLRFMDWFVTRFCYLYKSTINIANQFCTQNNFNINISYKAQLKSFTKKYFDPFKRKKKFIFTLDKQKISFLTTLGQLNFFRWAMTHDIINYTETNYRTIVSKYDYVNSFFKKHASSNSSNSTNSTQSTNLTNQSMSANSLNTKSDSLDSNSVINDLYSVNNINNINNIVVENQLKNKSTYKMPRVSRNIYIEL